MDVPLLDDWHSHAREDARAKCHERLHDVRSAVLAWYDNSQVGWVEGRRGGNAADGCAEVNFGLTENGTEWPMTSSLPR